MSPSITWNAGDSRTSSTSFLYASPSTSTLAPLSALPSSLSASATRSTTYSGIAVLISPASSMKRVASPNSRAFQVR